jgi:hypothetical protein
MWETINYHKTTIFVIILVAILAMSWLEVPEEEVDDPFVISVDYDCREVVRDPEDIPHDIIQQCKELVRELESKNAPKQSKRSPTT